MYHPPARPGTDRSESYAELPERRGFCGPGEASLVREGGVSDGAFSVNIPPPSRTSPLPQTVSFNFRSSESVYDAG
ncbi:hypothetical protein ALO87_101866 [Pseudomonas syringae pv. apii]|nr:hypothetical protein ALO87_101866 [Pseudomonas syringae pv. apii]